jgi:palmitoyltransferase
MLIAFHIVFVMLLWSMFRSIFSDAGKVPIYWGFFAEESDNRKRRYCLLCHSFKPERYYSTHNLDAIIAQPASDVYSTWIIIVLGFQTVLGFQIASTSCFSCFTSF